MSEKSTFGALGASAPCRALGSYLLCLMGKPPLRLSVQSIGLHVTTVTFFLRFLRFFFKIQKNVTFTFFCFASYVFSNYGTKHTLSGSENHKQSWCCRCHCAVEAALLKRNTNYDKPVGDWFAR